MILHWPTVPGGTVYAVRAMTLKPDRGIFPTALSVPGVPIVFQKSPIRSPEFLKYGGAPGRVGVVNRYRE